MSQIGKSLDSGIDTISSKMGSFYIEQQAGELQSIVAYSRGINLRKTEKMVVVILEEAAFFDSGSTILKLNLELEKVVNVLIKYAKTLLSIKGYSDSSVSEIENQKISKLQVEVIKNFLIEKGVDLKRFGTIGPEETKPIDSSSLKKGSIEVQITSN